MTFFVRFQVFLAGCARQCQQSHAEQNILECELVISVKLITRAGAPELRSCRDLISTVRCRALK